MTAPVHFSFTSVMGLLLIYRRELTPPAHLPTMPRHADQKGKRAGQGPEKPMTSPWALNLNPFRIAALLRCQYRGINFLSIVVPSLYIEMPLFARKAASALRCGHQSEVVVCRGHREVLSKVPYPLPLHLSMKPTNLESEMNWPSAEIPRLLQRILHVPVELHCLMKAEWEQPCCHCASLSGSALHQIPSKFVRPPYRNKNSPMLLLYR
jgi:hypothetical protein